MVDSPLLWSGKKTNLLEQLKPLFYKKADIFFDVFSGSGSILANTDYNQVIGNDIYSGKLLECLIKTDYEVIEKYVNDMINKFDLSKENKEEYYTYKRYILNQKHINQLDLYTLSNFAFNGRLEFNLKGEITSGFGKRNRKNTSLTKLKIWKQSINQKCFVTNKDYISFCKNIIKVQTDKEKFVYLDPPYSITRTNGYESNYTDEKLFEILNYFNKIGIKWGMSNVFAHKGKINNKLIEFAKQYKVDYLDFDYANNNRSNNLQQEMEQSNKTVEVYIRNY